MFASRDGRLSVETDVHAPVRTVIRLESFEGFPVLSISGEVDLSNSPAVDEALALLDAESFIVVSLEQCTFFDSTLLNVLIRRHFNGDGNLVIVLPDSSPLGRIFDITKLRETLHLVPDRRAAAELAATIRDLGAVHFSRDGVLEGPT